MFENEELFNDLPEEPVAGEPELTEVEKEKERNINSAAKGEEDRLARAKKALDDKRKARKEAEAELEKSDEPKAEEPKTEVAQEVQKALGEEKRKNYLSSVAEQIRGLAKNRKEAMEAYEEAIKLPPTGDAKLDAEFAFDRVQKLRGAKRGFTPPTVGGSFADMPGDENRGDHGLPKGQLDHLRRYNLSDDEIKKYKDGVKFDRLFTKR